MILAGAEGVEPSNAVLETAGLAISLRPRSLLKRALEEKFYHLRPWAAETWKKIDN